MKEAHLRERIVGGRCIHIVLALPCHMLSCCSDASMHSPCTCAFLASQKFEVVELAFIAPERERDGAAKAEKGSPV